MDTVAIHKSEYEELIQYKAVIENIGNEMLYNKAKKISDLVKTGKMKVYSQEEVLEK